MEQSQRDDIMHKFRTGTSRVLITTDLLARGIDVQQLSLVLNYDLPADKVCPTQRTHTTTVVTKNIPRHRVGWLKRLLILHSPPRCLSMHFPGIVPAPYRA